MRSLAVIVAHLMRSHNLLHEMAQHSALTCIHDRHLQLKGLIKLPLDVRCNGF